MKFNYVEKAEAAADRLAPVSLRLPAALLFDLDGTIVESDDQHFVAFRRILAPFGVDLDRARYDAEILGKDNEWIGRHFLPDLSPDARGATLAAKEAIYRDNLGAIEPVVGLVELLDYADANGLGRALVTNAPRANADAVLAKLGLSTRLATIVSGDEISRAKPDPLPYRTALERTGAEAPYSVAFEDSISGVDAAVAAGIAVVGIVTTLDEDRLVDAGATFAVADFRDAQVYKLIESRLAALKRAEPVTGSCTHRA